MFAVRQRVLPSSLRHLHTIADVQRVHWNVYVASGRGSAALFGSIDSDADGLVGHDEIRTFVDAIETSNDIMERALHQLDETTETQKIDLASFQQWLIDATHSAGYQDARTLYDTRPDIGRRKTAEGGTFAWNQTTMSQSLRRMQYAVRGEVVIKADELKAQGKEIIYTNIGNPHSVGQKPITYYRQVSALCDLPAESGVDHPMVSSLFPSDVVDHARQLRDIIGPAGTGAYTNSQGLVGFRRHVVQYLQDRDGHDAFEGDIFLTNGASAGIEMIMSAIIATDFDAVMVPIPQYPIYSALIARLAGREIGYELDEEQGWAITEEELYKQLNDAKAKGVTVRALALINPGNPTGQLMGVDQLEMVGKFCVDNGIVLLADEVYQRNVYADDKQFVSMKKVAVESPQLSNLELVSFHSTSKGLIGECGRRGGYMELHNIDPYVHSQLYKLASSELCSSVNGQVMTSLMVQGPKESGPSFRKFKEEETSIFDSLKRKSKFVVDALNSIDGVWCVPSEGAMYAFPRVEVPPAAWDEAKRKRTTPDTLYALSLLEKTGICVVPASGFGQREGRVGFRTTFLPPEETLAAAAGDFAEHHEFFRQKFT